jgi:opacity protein-like surface antigen
VGGLVLGADLLTDENKQVGLFVAFNRMKLSEHDAANQNISGNSYHLGVYGAWGTTGGLTLSGIFGYSFGDHESDRMVPDVGAFTGGTAKADFDSRGFYVGTEAAQRLDLNGRFALIPSVSAIFSQTTQRSTTESGGGDFNFDLHDNTAESFLTSVGLTAELQMGDESTDWSLLGAAYYYYDWLAANNELHEITAYNPITGTITQVGQNRGAHGLTLGLGINGQLTKSIAVGAGYAYGWNENGNEHGVSINFSMVF